MSYSELFFILDRSGSMHNICLDMEGAIASVLSKQKENQERVLVTYARFDSQYEEVFFEKDISEIDGLRLEPRGSTAFLDAIGISVNTFASRYEKKEEKPQRVLFIIITDGQENASTEYNRDSILKLIDEYQSKYDWGFTFIGSNQDSIAEGNKIGISKNCSLNYTSSAVGVRDMSRSVSCFVSNYLSAGECSYDSAEDKPVDIDKKWTNKNA